MSRFPSYVQIIQGPYKTPIVDVIQGPYVGIRSAIVRQSATDVTIKTNTQTVSIVSIPWRHVRIRYD